MLANIGYGQNVTARSVTGNTQLVQMYSIESSKYHAMWEVETLGDIGCCAKLNLIKYMEHTRELGIPNHTTNIVRALLAMSTSHVCSRCAVVYTLPARTTLTSGKVNVHQIHWAELSQT